MATLKRHKKDNVRLAGRRKHVIGQGEEAQVKVGPKVYVGPQWIKGRREGSFGIHSFILFLLVILTEAHLRRRAKSAVLFSTRDLQTEISTSTSGDFKCPLRRGVLHFSEGIAQQQQ